jgi:hypothetical protein
MVPSLSCGRHKEFGEGGRPRIALYHTVGVVVHYSNFRWPMSAKGQLRHFGRDLGRPLCLP